MPQISRSVELKKEENKLKWERGSRGNPLRTAAKVKQGGLFQLFSPSKMLLQTPYEKICKGAHLKREM